MVPPPSFLDYIGDLTNQENFIKRLKDAVAIQR